MFTTKTNFKSLKNHIFSFLRPPPLYQQQPLYIYIQISNYVDVKMKWKKDSFYDSIETIYLSQQLKPLIALKNCIIQEPDGCIPISDVSKRGFEFGVTTKVLKFMRQCPSIFEEFTGPQYNLPWFRLTQEAIDLDFEEKKVYEERRGEIVDRLKRLILMADKKMLPLKIIQGMQWYLGLPDEFLKNLEGNLDSSFRLVEMGEGLQGLSVGSEEKVLSLLQKNSIKRGEYLEDEEFAPLAFPLLPSKGLRLKTKISNWLNEFQKLPYVSPYEDPSHLNRSSDDFEKRVVGVLHELLSIFVDHSAERKKLLCLRTYLGLPQKFYKAFERHPHIFYLSLRNKTCTAILKEAYNDDLEMETHPLLNVRKKYIRLMKKSDTMLKRRRQKNQSSELDKLNTNTYDEAGDKDGAADGVLIFESFDFSQSVEGLCEAQSDVVLVCTSILSTEAVLRSIPVHMLKHDTIFADVLSVKEFPRNLLLEILPPGFAIVCMHPMFGPVSGKDGWTGLPFVFDRVRINQSSVQAQKCSQFLGIFEQEVSSYFYCFWASLSKK